MYINNAVFIIAKIIDNIPDFECFNEHMYELNVIEIDIKIILGSKSIKA